MGKQRTKGTPAECAIHTILLLGKDQDRLGTIARSVAAHDRVVIIARSKAAIRSVFEVDNVRVAIVDIDNADDLKKVVPSLKRRRNLPLVLHSSTPKTFRQRLDHSSLSTRTKSVTTPFLEREIGPLLHGPSARPPAASHQ